jgi:phage shock protein C
MTMQSKRFELDREEALFLGVCSGVARHFGFDVTLVRIGVVLVTLLGGFPWTGFAYFAAAWFGRPERGERESRAERPFAAGDTKSERIRDLRMKAIEASQNNDRLAREIEALRNERAPQN